VCRGARVVKSGTRTSRCFSLLSYPHFFLKKIISRSCFRFHRRRLPWAQSGGVSLHFVDRDRHARGHVARAAWPGAPAPKVADTRSSYSSSPPAARNARGCGCPCDVTWAVGPATWISESVFHSLPGPAATSSTHADRLWWLPGSALVNSRNPACPSQPA
jgi:hypothetical protein